MRTGDAVIANDVSGAVGFGAVLTVIGNRSLVLWQNGRMGTVPSCVLIPAERVFEELTGKPKEEKER